MACRYNTGPGCRYRTTRGTGLQILRLNGCFACHSTDRSQLVGPTFAGLYGSTVRVMTDGVEREVVADDEYIRRSIYEPNADITVGYPAWIDAIIQKSYK
jgi:hypothetical protein